jgi:hypothetical protein
VGASTTHAPVGLHVLFQGDLYLFIYGDILTKEKEITCDVSFAKNLYVYSINEDQ